MIVAGIGSRSSATASEISDVIQIAETEAGLRCALIATLDRDGARDAILEAGHRCGCEVRLLSLRDLVERSKDCVTHSQPSMIRYGVPSVAEASALAAAGPKSRLAMCRLAAHRVTVAIAIAHDAPPGPLRR